MFIQIHLKFCKFGGQASLFVAKDVKAGNDSLGVGWGCWRSHVKRQFGMKIFSKFHKILSMCVLVG